MRKSIYDRNLAIEFGRLKLEEITPMRLMARHGIDPAEERPDAKLEHLAAQ